MGAWYWLVALIIRLLPGASELKAQEILELMDRKLFGHSDDYFRIRMKIGDGSAADPTIDVFQKVVRGKMMRLVRFVAPPDLRGMGVLTESRDVMYVYLPGYDKVRRVGAHIRSQSFMGSDFIYDDLGVIAWAPDYVAQIVSSSASEWVLSLTPLPDRDPTFAKLVMTISRKCLLFTRLDYYDDKGNKVRTQLREIDPARCEMKRLAAVSHARGGHRTDGEVLFYSFDKGLPDDLFTVRSLARGF